MIKKIAHNPVFAILLTASFLFASCSSDSNEDNSASEAKAKTELTAENLSGKELFKAVIFADGALANKIDFVKDHFDVLSTLKTQEEINSFRSAENEAISYLEKNDPLFFDNFKKSMLTRDPSVILKTLNEASLALAPLTNQKIANAGLTVEKVKANAGLLKAGKTGKQQSEACVAVLFYWAYPGLLLAAALAVEQAPVALADVDNNILADEYALSIANNI